MLIALFRCGAAPHDDRGGDYATAFTGIVLIQTIGQRLIEESRRHQNLIDIAQPSQRQIGEAAADAVADHEGAGEDGGGDRHADNDGEVDAAKVPEVAEEEGESVHGDLSVLSESATAIALLFNMDEQDGQDKGEDLAFAILSCPSCPSMFDFSFSTIDSRPWLIRTRCFRSRG